MNDIIKHLLKHFGDKTPNELLNIPLNTLFGESDKRPVSDAGHSGLKNETALKMMRERFSLKNVLDTALSTGNISQGQKMIYSLAAKLYDPEYLNTPLGYKNQFDYLVNVLTPVYSTAILHANYSNAKNVEVCSLLLDPLRCGDAPELANRLVIFSALGTITLEHSGDFGGCVEARGNFEAMNRFEDFLKTLPDGFIIRKDNVLEMIASLIGYITHHIEAADPYKNPKPFEPKVKEKEAEEIDPYVVQKPDAVVPDLQGMSLIAASFNTVASRHCIPNLKAGISSAKIPTSVVFLFKKINSYIPREKIEQEFTVIKYGESVDMAPWRVIRGVGSLPGTYSYIFKLRGIVIRINFFGDTEMNMQVASYTQHTGKRLIDWAKVPLLYKVAAEDVLSVVQNILILAIESAEEDYNKRYKVVTLVKRLVAGTK